MIVTSLKIYWLRPSIMYNIYVDYCHTNMMELAMYHTLKSASINQKYGKLEVSIHMQIYLVNGSCFTICSTLLH